MRFLLIALGVVLLAGGIFFLLAGDVSYSERKDVVDPGSVRLTHETSQHLSMPPAASALAIVAGAGLVFVGMRKR